MEMKLKIAIQKSGRLNEDSIKILKESGINTLIFFRTSYGSD